MVSTKTTVQRMVSLFDREILTVFLYRVFGDD